MEEQQRGTGGVGGGSQCMRGSIAIANQRAFDMAFERLISNLCTQSSALVNCPWIEGFRRAQPLHEIQGSWYFDSDVVAVQDGMWFEQPGTDRVALRGVKGRNRNMHGQSHTRRVSQGRSQPRLLDPSSLHHCQQGK
jgi:hypothetical protein